MFEYDQDIVQVLLEEDERFQELYEYHGKLKEKVHDVESGVRPMDDLSLGILKKEKLLAKDKMALIISQYRRENPEIGVGSQRCVRQILEEQDTVPFQISSYGLLFVALHTLGMVLSCSSPCALFLGYRKNRNF